jgi:hypothetical protein
VGVWENCGSVGKFRSLGHVADSILGVSLMQVFLVEQSKSHITKGKKRKKKKSLHQLLFHACIN